MNLRGNTILITGGGSGIGRELARRFARLDNFVIVAGRNPQKLAETVQGESNMAAMMVDLRHASDVLRLAAEVTCAHPELNVLINNAGAMRREDLSRRRDLSDCEDMIATNLLGPIRMTNALIDHLSQSRDPAIVNISSGLAFVPMAGTPTYCATKAAIHSYTVSLRAALKDKVEVIEIAPPGVRTDLTPGLTTLDSNMPVDAFVEEVIALLEARPTAPEVLVESVQQPRWAERNGEFDSMVSLLARF